MTLLDCLAMLFVGCALQSIGIADEAPQPVVSSHIDVPGWEDIVSCGPLIAIAEPDPAAIKVWTWSDAGLRKLSETRVQGTIFSLGMLPNNRWIAIVFDEQAKATSWCVGDSVSGKVVARQNEPFDGTGGIGKGSRNGAHLTAWNYRQSGEVQLGLVTNQATSVDWATSLTISSEPARSLGVKSFPSENGNVIGVVLWDKEIGMVDTVKKKILWTASIRATESKKLWKTVPLDVYVDDMAFTPDGKTVYVGGWVGSDLAGAVGCLKSIDVETGETVSKWDTATPSPEKYSRTITTISVSPDGRYVAAGTVPNGLVFLYSAKDGKRSILNHGGSAAIDFTSFSPDSKRLATFAAGQIKIWKLPEEPAKAEATKAEPAKPETK